MPSRAIVPALRSRKSSISKSSERPKILALATTGFPPRSSKYVRTRSFSLSIFPFFKKPLLIKKSSMLVAKEAISTFLPTQRNFIITTMVTAKRNAKNLAISQILATIQKVKFGNLLILKPHVYVWKNKQGLIRHGST